MRSDKIKIIAAIYFSIIAAIVILADVKSTQYLLRFSGGIPYFDKIAHFLLMGGFSFFVNLTFRGKEFSLWNFRYLQGTLIVLLIVTIEEFSQIYVAGRTFDAGDLAADYAGIFIFGEAARFIYQKYLIRC
ncbi:MAG: VanZ family protein [Acidobacteria bacterium]|nr:VanZ family protein [Acidobacteriota bacterium]